MTEDDNFLPTPKQVEEYWKYQQVENKTTTSNDESKLRASDDSIQEIPEPASPTPIREEVPIPIQEDPKGIDKIISTLPVSLQDCVSVFQTPTERLMALFTSITVTGALMPHVTVNYANETTFLALMLSVIFPPASGKGSLTQVRKLLVKINDHLLSEYKTANQKYELEMGVYKKNMKSGNPTPKPEKPPMLMMLLPGNTSSAQVVASLSECCPENILAIFETEMDSFGVTATKGDFGTLNSTYLRLAFQNEPITSFRKTNCELLRAEKPKVVAVFIGTPNQVGGVLNANDGTLTRFLIVMGNSPVIWKNVQPCPSCVNLDKHFDSLSEKWLEMWKVLVKTHVEVTFSNDQWARINKFGAEKLALLHHFTGENASGIAKRHGIMIVRIAAILSMVRYYERNDTSGLIECEERDFTTALWMVAHSLECSQALYKILPRLKGNQEDKNSSNKLALLKSLPASFKIAEAKQRGKDIGVSDRSMSRWLAGFLDSGYLERIGHGEYKKTDMAALALSSFSDPE